MKITQEYEAKDIDTKNDKLHSTLFMALALTMVTWPKVTPNETDEGILESARGQVALFLNMMDRSGFIISPKEDIPEVFRSA